ncbi:DUF4389 domain-containing protein [Marinomonas spartinae]|uniref:DUF4389 domain-containing protein n=1 Tax=Marinomonas spartinae TaxID=1792290 RepID=UPI0018F1F0D8|nr:DUF4389 domain-containing protein [Marinomonas spartinae]MBJ7554150.1 DUF4389 domain-containing protein [Marinomonas spartinae]
MAKPSYTDQGFWLRLIYMVLYWLILNIALTVFGALIVVVSLIRLLTSSKAEMLSGWLTSVSMFIRQACRFLSFEDEEKPFPFQPWPKVNTDEQN